jgi:hypothetical protein
MKKLLILTSMIFASTQVIAADRKTNCTLAQKELNVIKSEQDMIVEKYKISVKTSLGSQMKNQNGQKLLINIDPNNEYLKTIAKLSIAEATLEAMIEMCGEGTLPASAPKGPYDYTAQIIPKQ